MIDTILYFGSFNPIHKGHTAIVDYLLGHGFCDELWLVVSPHNPLKESFGLVGEQDRLAMARIAAAESTFCDRIRVSDVEFSMPRPSYTIDTLAILEKRYGDRRFSVLIGSDNVDSLDQWKDYQKLIDEYKFFVYPRKGAPITKFEDRVTLLADAPMWDYSSTEVRDALAGDRDKCAKMLNASALGYIIENKLWTKEKVYKAK